MGVGWGRGLFSRGEGGLKKRWMYSSLVFFLRLSVKEGCYPHQSSTVAARGDEEEFLI